MGILKAPWNAFNLREERPAIHWQQQEQEVRSFPFAGSESHISLYTGVTLGLPQPCSFSAGSGQDPVSLELLCPPELWGQAAPALRLCGTAPQSILLCVSARWSALAREFQDVFSGNFADGPFLVASKGSSISGLFHCKCHSPGKLKIKPFLITSESFWKELGEGGELMRKTHSFRNRRAFPEVNRI